MLYYKYIMLVGLLGILGLSGCAAKNQGVSDKEYMRSNNASEKALKQLDRE